jgi:hypothetical protein
MIWVGVIILTIIGIFFTRISIFVDRTSDPYFAEENTDETDGLNDIVPPSNIKQKQTIKQPSLEVTHTSKEIESKIRRL